MRIYFLFTAWCLKNDNVNSVLLGASTVDQLYTNIQALQVQSRNEASKWEKFIFEYKNPDQIIGPLL